MAGAGLTTFALLYHVQPLLPLLADTFKVGAAESALSLSLSTGALSICLLLAGSLSEVVGRKPVMVGSLLLSSLLTIAVALTPSWPALLLARMLTGVALAGLPAIAMAYLGEEMQPKALGLAMGLYIAASALGGMVGRLVTGIAADHLDWHWIVAGIGTLGLISGATLWHLLPPSRQFRRQSPDPRILIGSLLAQFRDPGLCILFALAFLLMGSFVAIYNFIGFHLLQPPYNLSQSAIGLIFSAYLLGMGGSAWIGALALRVGRHRVLPVGISLMAVGMGLTALTPLPAIIAGIALMTFSFFAAHSVASSWVSARATTGKAQASSLYLFFYYMGSSFVGSGAGLAWERAGWAGVVVLVGGLLALALLLALSMRRHA
ncbi:MFS transporter [Niveispirillum sp. SYP-B3756]|nr:MFS transporter [Niveispirillum sp. SYP-B3756]MQP67298.1 MFS transporter [Niveispirillum sp. SYP-B3756]